LHFTAWQIVMPMILAGVGCFLLTLRWAAGPTRCPGGPSI
jgi:hypothetical protein